MSRPSICLNMIVKNEAHVIERCLASARPLIDAWCIVDTGSSDGTQGKIGELMAGIPGTLHERPWKNFGHNRGEALDLARANPFPHLGEFAKPAIGLVARGTRHDHRDLVVMGGGLKEGLGIDGLEMRSRVGEVVSIGGPECCETTVAFAKHSDRQEDAVSDATFCG